MSSDAPERSKPRFQGSRRLSLRTETVILLPVATLVLVTLSAFTLFAFRSAVFQLAEERRDEAARVARNAAEAAAALTRPTVEDLRRLAPFARGAAIADRQGRVVVAFGEIDTGSILQPLHGHFPDGPQGAGPSREAEGVVAGFAVFGPPSAPFLLRIDLAAPTLDAQLRGLRILTVVVIAIDAGLALLVLAFLRYVLRPYDALLARARALGGDPGDGDDIEFLVAMFERAVAAAAPEGTGIGDDIAALQRALSPSLESGLLILDRSGTILGTNPVGAKLLGLDATATGRPLDEALAAHGELVTLLRDALASGGPIQRAEVGFEAASEGRETAQTGRRVLGLTVHPLRRDDGGVRGFLVLFADLTAIRAKEDARRLADNLHRIGELAAGIAHELRNSLATLRGYLTLIARRPSEETVDDYLGEMRHETDHLQRVLEDFLAFARPGSTRLEDVDLQAIVRRAAADPALGGARIELDLPLPTADAAMLGDPLLLERAVRNLLHNAVQASLSPDGTSTAVSVGLRRISGDLELEILDRGPGVPEDVREKLFVPFVTSRAGGVGLGLALTQRIVALHGGSIRLESRPEGGTAARVSFPGASAPPSLRQDRSLS